MKKIYFILLTIVFLGAGCIGVLQKKSDSTMQNMSDKTQTKPVVDTSNWTTYNNKYMGYDISYPSKYNTLLLKNPNEINYGFVLLDNDNNAQLEIVNMHEAQVVYDNKPMADLTIDLSELVHQKQSIIKTSKKQISKVKKSTLSGEVSYEYTFTDDNQSKRYVYTDIGKDRYRISINEDDNTESILESIKFNPLTKGWLMYVDVNNHISFAYPKQVEINSTNKDNVTLKSPYNDDDPYNVKRFEITVATNNYNDDSLRTAAQRYIDFEKNLYSKQRNEHITYGEIEETTFNGIPAYKIFVDGNGVYEEPDVGILLSTVDHTVYFVRKNGEVYVIKVSQDTLMKEVSRSLELL